MKVHAICLVAKNMPEIFEDLMAEKYLYRIVTSPEELREK